MTVQSINKLKIIKKRKLKVRRFQSDRNEKVKVYLFLKLFVAQLEKTKRYR